MSGPRDGEQLVSIWTWCGGLVALYGILLTGFGVYYIVRPETETATAHLNPSLWWGLVMLVSGAALLFLPKLTARLGERRGTNDISEEGS